MSKGIAFVTLVMLAVTTALATPVSIINPSFETWPDPLSGSVCGTDCWYTGGLQIPGWSGGSGQFFPGPSPSAYFDSLPDGPTVAWIMGGAIAPLTQEVGAVAASTTYTLRVDVGWRKDEGSTWKDPIIRLMVGNTPVTLGTGSAPVQGGFSTYTAVYTASGADLGKTLTIYLDAGVDSVHQGIFDNVRLDATSTSVVPEPGTLILLASGLLGFARKFRRVPLPSELACGGGS